MSPVPTPLPPTPTPASPATPEQETTETATPIALPLPMATLVGPTYDGTCSSGHKLTAGDFNGDGLADIVLSGPLLRGAETTCDSAMFLIESPLQQTTYLANATTVFSDEANEPTYAAALWSDGDTNGDGLSDLVVTTVVRSTSTRSVRMFRPPFIAHVLFTESNFALTPAYSGLGSVSIAFDFTGDGRSDILAGAEHADDPVSGVDTGQAYIIPGDLEGEWAVEDVILHQFVGVDDGDEFGTSVASVGDVNGDGTSDIVVGSPYWGSGYTGAAFLFTSPFDPITWAESATATVEGLFGGYDCTIVWCLPYGSQTGMNVGYLGDFSSDRTLEYLVHSIGTIHILSGTTTGTVDAESGTNIAQAIFVAVSGDLDGDEKQDLYAEGSNFTSLCIGSQLLSESAVLDDCIPIHYDSDMTGSPGEQASADVNGDAILDLIIALPYMMWGGKQVGGAIVYSGADIKTYVQAVLARRRLVH